MESPSSMMRIIQRVVLVALLLMFLCDSKTHHRRVLVDFSLLHHLFPLPETLQRTQEEADRLLRTARELKAQKAATARLELQVSNLGATNRRLLLSLEEALTRPPPPTSRLLQQRLFHRTSNNNTRKRRKKGGKKTEDLSRLETRETQQARRGNGGYPPTWSKRENGHGAGHLGIGNLRIGVDDGGFARPRAQRPKWDAAGRRPRGCAVGHGRDDDRHHHDKQRQQQDVVCDDILVQLGVGSV